MCGNAKEFNQPIGDWYVSKVTDMRFMFKYARDFNQPIGDWDVSNVTDMIGMFYDALKFGLENNLNDVMKSKRLIK